ncbi:hypothetical protein [Methanosarcina horonobensis]|nr:hypothetical protein [Methanosarcina horonobensis]
MDTLCNYGCLLYRLGQLDKSEEAYKKKLFSLTRGM